MAVEPKLASTLWPAHQHAHARASSKPTRITSKLSTHHKAIDSALCGGIDYSSITCISAEADSSSKQLMYAVIATHLLESATAEATVIDTTNSFDVRGLHRIVVARIQDDVDGRKQVDLVEQAVHVLERVRLMKAFDFIGLTECITELREHLEAASASTSQEPEQQPKLPRGTVGDSEDEDEDEMLDFPAPPRSPQPNESKLHATGSLPNTEQASNLLVIDNITHVTTPLLKNSHIQGQALLIPFMRSLAHLTKAHQLSTIVHNLATAYVPLTGSKPTTQTTEDTPSIFSSCKLKPALGRTFGYMVDVHMLLHRVPLEHEDAQVVYGTQRPGQMAGQRKMASVLEVLADRYSSRVGRWAAFQTDSEGKLIGIT